MSETALIIEVPESELLLGELRSQYDQNVSVGVPAHIQIFIPTGRVGTVRYGIVAKACSGAAVQRVDTGSLAAFSFVPTLWRRV